jgi:hypothetical protein
VFPLAPRDKHPIVRKGLKQATTNPNTIERWWKRTPDANIALLCGKGLLVVDVDGPIGRKSLTFLERQHGRLPATVTAKTARGRHYFFDVGDGPAVTTSGVLGSKLDTRGDDSYVVAPPSIHPSGKTYRWERPPGTPLAKAPKWLVQLLADHAARAPGAPKATGTTPVESRPRAYGAGTYRELDNSRSGVDLRLCFKLVREGWRDDQIAAELERVSEKVADYSDPASYIARTVAFARGCHEAGNTPARVVGVWLQHYGAYGGKKAMTRVKMALFVEGIKSRVDAFVVVPTLGYESSQELYGAILGDIPWIQLAKGNVEPLRKVLNRRLEVAVKGGVVKWMRRMQ